MYESLYADHSVSDAPYLAGQYLVYALLIWWIFWAVFLRKRIAKKKSISFIAIYAALFLGSLMGVSRQKQRSLTTYSVLQQELWRVSHPKEDARGIPIIEKDGPELDLTVGSDSEKMDRLTKQLGNDLLEMQKNYLEELNDCGWDSLLSAERVENDKTFSESYAILENAMATANKFEKQHQSLVLGFPERIKALRVADELKKSMIKGYENGIKKGSGRIEEHWARERQTIDLYGDLIAFLRENQKWKANGGKFIFESTEELDHYNSYLEKIKEITAQEEQLKSKRISELDQKLEDMKKDLTK